MITCLTWTESPTLSAQGSESCSTDTWPVTLRTVAACSGAAGNSWAQDTLVEAPKRRHPTRALLKKSSLNITLKISAKEADATSTWATMNSQSTTTIAQQGRYLCQKHAKVLCLLGDCTKQGPGKG